jgi:hypothetical protein
MLSGGEQKYGQYCPSKSSQSSATHAQPRIKISEQPTYSHPPVSGVDLACAGRAVAKASTPITVTAAALVISFLETAIIVVSCVEL